MENNYQNLIEDRNQLREKCNQLEMAFQRCQETKIKLMDKRECAKCAKAMIANERKHKAEVRKYREALQMIRNDPMTPCHIDSFIDATFRNSAECAKEGKHEKA